MCGSADFTVSDRDIWIRLGYWGGDMNVDNCRYEYRSEDDCHKNLAEMREVIEGFSKAELVDLIFGMLRHGEEA